MNHSILELQRDHCIYLVRKGTVCKTLCLTQMITVKQSLLGEQLKVRFLFSFQVGAF